MDFQSLRVRLLLGAAAAVFAALALSWLAMTLLFERHLERRVEAELTREALQLVADLALDARGSPVAARVPVDSRFIEPASGFYWQMATRNGILRSRSLWDQELPAPSAAQSRRWDRRMVAGPFGQELALFLLLLWLVLSGAAWLQVQLGLRPLERVRRELEHLRHSPAERLRATHASEIEPLTAEINALADARERGELAAGRRPDLVPSAAGHRAHRRRGRAHGLRRGADLRSRRPRRPRSAARLDGPLRADGRAHRKRCEVLAAPRSHTG